MTQLIVPEPVEHPVHDAVAEALMEHGPDGHTDGYKQIAGAALLAVPEGWAKLYGRWVQLEPWTPDEVIRWAIVGEG